MWKGAGTISYSTEGRSGILTDLEIFQLTVTGMLCVHILPKLFTGPCERLGHKIWYSDPQTMVTVLHK